MASRIQGITVENGGDTMKLTTALKGVNTEIRSTQSQLKDVEKLLKLDPSNTELLSQKQRFLNEEVQATKEKLEALKNASEQANAALEQGMISRDQYDALQRENIATEQALEDLEEQAEQSSVALQKIANAGESLQSVGDKVSDVGKKMSVVSTGIVAAGTASTKMALDFEDAMAKVSTIADETEVPIEEIGKCRASGLGYKKIAEQMGLSENTVKTYCRRHGLGGNMAQQKNMAQTEGHHCLCCGAVVEQTPGRKEKKFCSDRCRNKWWNSHLDKVERKANGKYQFKYHVDGKPQFVYSWRLEPTDPLPIGKKPCLSLRELEKMVGYDLDNRLDPTGKNMTVRELVDKYVATKRGVKNTTRAGYKTVQRFLEKELFGGKKISSIKTSDAKLFLIKLQEQDGKSYSSIHTLRGVLRPAFQIAVDDDVLIKNPFDFQLVNVLVNDSVTREAITKEQMNKFLKFIRDDNVYWKYYDVVYILFHTGMRISDGYGKIRLKLEQTQ